MNEAELLITLRLEHLRDKMLVEEKAQIWDHAEETWNEFYNKNWNKLYQPDIAIEAERISMLCFIAEETYYKTDTKFKYNEHQLHQLENKLGESGLSKC